MGRGLAPFQDIEPPGIVGTADPHVVRHDVEDEAHAVFVQRRDQRVEIGLAADLRIEPAVVDDVVAVRRAGPRLHQRRGVKVADAEPGEIRHQRRGVAKREVLVELQSVGGADLAQVVIPEPPVHSDCGRPGCMRAGRPRSD